MIAKGDKINVVYELSPGVTRELEVVADGVGRTVEFSRDDKKNLVTIEVAGRAGTATRTINLRADKVILVEEVPA